MRISDLPAQIIFWSLFGLFIVTFTISNWNSSDTFLTKLGTGFAIGSTFVSCLVALWVLDVEREKRHNRKVENAKNKEENDYYKMGLIHDLSALVSYIRIAWRYGMHSQEDYWCDASVREKVFKSIRESEPAIFGLCADIQMLNLNPYAPAPVKSRVSMIIRTAQKTNSVDSIGVVENLFSRINWLLDMDYMKDVDDNTVQEWISNLRKDTKPLDMEHVKDTKYWRSPI